KETARKIGVDLGVDKKVLDTIIANASVGAENLSTRDRLDATRVLESEAKKTFGVKTEDVAAAQYGLEHVLKIAPDNKIYSSSLLKSNPYEFMLRGKVDRVIVEDTGNLKRVVEIKNRKNHLMERLPQYEYVQCLAYMKLTGAHQVDLYQRYND